MAELATEMKQPGKRLGRGILPMPKDDGAKGNAEATGAPEENPDKTIKAINAGKGTPFKEKTCDKLRALRTKGIRAKVKEADLIATRRSLEEQIAECSDGEARKLDRLKADHFDTEQSIDAQRAILKELPGLYEKAIDDDAQDKLIDDGGEETGG